MAMMRKRSATAFRLSVAMAALLVLGLAPAGCRTAAEKVAAVPKSCPDGAELKGSPPPGGTEIWCEKDVGGVPVKDGIFVTYNLNGDRMLEGYYHDGKQTGEWTMWYNNGQRASVDHYRDGVQDGEHISWYANGVKAIEGTYRDGKREGVWHRWDPNGLRVWTDVYKDDIKVSSTPGAAPGSTSAGGTSGATSGGSVANQ
jgi:MORN repeat variant